MRPTSVSIGRRKVSLDDPTAWVFNKMVDAYQTRPPYPNALVDATAREVAPASRVLDVGAGVGHLALPLAKRGFRVTAVEPAINMLAALRASAEREDLPVTTCQAQAEELPFDDESFELVILADALHFIDSERAARELARVLTRTGQLAVLRWDLAATPFMQALRAIMEESAPRRPRNVQQSIVELFAVAGMAVPPAHHFSESLPVTAPELDGLLRSISFIGPAMNAHRFEAFQERVRAIPHPPVWARDFTLFVNRRRR